MCRATIALLAALGGCSVFGIPVPSPDMATSPDMSEFVNDAGVCPLGWVLESGVCYEKAVPLITDAGICPSGWIIVESKCVEQE